MLDFKWKRRVGMGFRKKRRERKTQRVRMRERLRE
jgi:hypothetical protein